MEIAALKANTEEFLSTQCIGRDTVEPQVSGIPGEVKNPAAVALGRLGGLARANALSAVQRMAIAQKAAIAKRKRAEVRKLLEAQ